MSEKNVIIIQSYVPEYRKPFFELLNSELLKSGIKLQLQLDMKVFQTNSNRDSVTTNVPTFIGRTIHIPIGRSSIVVRWIRWQAISADLVVIEQAVKDISNLFLLLVRKVLRKKTVVWGHGLDYVVDAHGTASKLRHQMLKLATAAFVYTDQAKLELSNGGIRESRLFSVQNSIDTKELRRKILDLSPDEVRAFIKEHNLSEFNLLYLGTLSESKNIDLLLASVKYAQSRQPNLRFLIVGDGPLREKIEKFVLENDWAVFLERSETAKILALATASVMVIAGRVGLVATDSIASGIPIVTVKNRYHAPEFYYLEPPQDSLECLDTAESLGQGIINSLQNEVNISLKTFLSSKKDLFSVEMMVRNFMTGLERVLEE